MDGTGVGKSSTTSKSKRNELGELPLLDWMASWHSFSRIISVYLAEEGSRSFSISLFLSLRHLSRVLVSPAHIPLLILASSIFILILPTGCSCPLRERVYYYYCPMEYVGSRICPHKMSNDNNAKTPPPH